MKKTLLLLVFTGVVLGALGARGAHAIPFAVDFDPSQTWAHVASPSPSPGRNTLMEHPVGMRAVEKVSSAFVSLQSSLLYSPGTGGCLSGDFSVKDDTPRFFLIEGGQYGRVDFREPRRKTIDDTSIAESATTDDTGTPIAKDGGAMLMLGFSLIGMAAIGRNKVVKRP